VDIGGGGEDEVRGTWLQGTSIAVVSLGWLSPLQVMSGLACQSGDKCKRSARKKEMRECFQFR
jgi:hypothetical protein